MSACKVVALTGSDTPREQQPQPEQHLEPHHMHIQEPGHGHDGELHQRQDRQIMSSPLEPSPAPQTNNSYTLPSSSFPSSTAPDITASPPRATDDTHPQRTVTASKKLQNVDASSAAVTARPPPVAVPSSDRPLSVSAAVAARLRSLSSTSLWSTNRGPISPPPHSNELEGANNINPSTRNTASSTAPTRISLSRTRHLWKSSSAVPTVSTTSAKSTIASTSGRTTPSERLVSAAATTTNTMATNAHSHDGFSVSSAADLLRQAMMQRAAAEEEHDQIGSNSSTPPGAATPRPDLTDKRLPGILHSYFGQATPPQTPRTRSADEKPTSNPSQTKSKHSRGSSLNSSTESATAVAPPKGRLLVTISEGRNLRPSFDPYVVCQFQQSEYISEGPKHDGAAKGAKENLIRGALPMQRTASDYGRSMAIPMRSRQSSNSGHSSDPAENDRYVTSPKWEHDAIFDVVGDHSELDVSVYDRSNQEAFLGHVRLCPNLIEYEKPLESWFTLEPREGEQNSDDITGEIHLRIRFNTAEKKHVGPEDFSILKLIGKGTFGQVFQVRKKDTRRIYAMKVLSKKVIVQKKEVAHTMGERNILVRTATVDSPFIVGLKFSFQTPTDLYLVTDYMSGGELFWHLQKEGRFLEPRAKFYIAELILALQHLHEHDIVYRDLKPENILLDAKGHIALCDFGLSKANLTDNATTNTFCGTTEYLAPEVLLDEHGYTKMVDFWSLGVLVFEMCCGWSPFYAEDTQQMYKNIAFGKVRFPRDALSSEGRSFVKGLLNRNPKHRLGSQRDAEELKEHPFFADIDWDALAKKNVPPPFKPKLKSEEDVSNFDPEFTKALDNGVGSLNARAAALASGVNPASTPLSPTLQNQFKGFTFVDDSAMEKHFRGREDLERMDEDGNDDADWENGFGRRGDRMSGVVPTDNDDGIFNHGGFDV